MMLSIISFTLLIGMAKPILSMEASLVELLEYLALVIPITSPYILNKGPPELPELMAQSVWIRFMVTLLESVTSRSSALTEPEVSENVSSPRGFPMATTSSPTLVLSESPRTTWARSSASTFKTARSLLSS